MSANPAPGWKRLLILPPVAIGIAALVWMVSGRQPPARVDVAEQARVVRVLSVEPRDLVPRATGYGPVSPAQVWSAVAQVSGQIVEMHRELRDGEVLPAETVLLKIDPADYELALARARAALTELDVQETNARKSLELEQASLKLAETERDRQQRLAKQGTTSRSSADEAERAVLSVQNAVQNLRNTLGLIPIQRRSLQTQVAQAELDLSRCVIRAPFNLRVAALAVERDQFVSKGQTLFRGDSVERVEVVAQFPLAELRTLFVGRERPDWSVEQLNERLTQFAGFSPVLRLDMGGHIAQWDAEFVRFTDSVDATTRTLGLVVAVDAPLQKVIPGERPPLSKGMFVEVRLSGRVQPGRLLIPRAAVRDGAVLIANAEDRLERRSVEVLFYQETLAVVGAGLTAGDRVVLTDLVPAVPGMLLRPQPDAEAAAEVARAAGV
ncbi:MAG: efflux RND transporter periplasmic adaptor subunit [Chromatiales bacterium]|nr:efflux RND transporter periplasmic adaptor subunit [Chromatiales bacterium]